MPRQFPHYGLEMLLVEFRIFDTMFVYKLNFVIHNSAIAHHTKVYQYFHHMIEGVSLEFHVSSSHFFLLYIDRLMADLAKVRGRGVFCILCSLRIGLCLSTIVVVTPDNYVAYF